MPVTRRTAMTLIGGITLGLTSASATGAFDRIEFERDITIEVDGDEMAYLSVVAHGDRRHDDPGLDVGHDEDGEFYINLGDQHINSGSVIEFDDLFEIANHGTQEITVDVEFLSGQTPVADVIEIYHSDTPNTPVPSIPAFGIEAIGMQLDASDPALLESVDTMVFMAESV